LAVKADHLDLGSADFYSVNFMGFD